MIYNQFNSMGSFANNPLLGRLPTSYTTTTNPFGPPRTTFGYGMRGLSPVNAAAAQKQEFGRLQGIQELQQSAFSLAEQQRKSEEEKKMEAARRRAYGMTDLEGTTSIDPYYLEMARREKEMEDLKLQRMRMESGVGGFGGGMFQAFAGGGSGGGSQSSFGRSWSVPSFPSMG